ncbi:MAG: RraA family protein [Verrucomicrobia bacterium]|nr:RraA family protein [Verrucomicrobiota bacterium]
MRDGTQDWPSLANRLEQCYTGAVYDVMRDFGMKDCVLPHAIRALDPGTRVAGPVFTMQGRPDPNCSVHESILRWTEFLSIAPAGHVVVCQPQDHTLALMGELSAETLHLRGVRGYIVDGGCRDNAFIQKLNFPVFARFQTPRDIAGAWTLEFLEQQIEIAGVQIRTGDFVLADIDGIVMVPEQQAEAVVAEVERVMNTENLVRKAILGGVSPKEAYLRYGKF